MSDEPKVEEAVPEDLTVEHAKSMGKQVGTFIAAALFEMNLAGSTADNIVLTNKAGPEVQKEFREQVWLVLGQALDFGVAGMVRRNELSAEMRSMHNDLLKEACNIALNKKQVGSEQTVKLLEGLLRTAGHCEAAAKSLYAGIHRNLDNLISSGRQIMTMQEIAKQQQGKQEDQAHDAPCEDPNCANHVKH